jgi:hypothetical protein
MAKAIPDAILDAMLDAAEGDKVNVCSAQPTTYTEANATYMLAQTTLTGGDFTAAAGDTSGRKNTLAAKSGVTITNSGTATHVAITNGTALRRVTTCTSQALTSGGTVDIGAHKHELATPT